ncbi:MAG: hypothetical protein WA859_18655 [Candidatus Sulfotelmatobacter sp.]
MANRKVRIVRDVKLDGEWTTVSVQKAQKLRIPSAEGRWYITWREGRRIRREQARDHGRAIELQSKKHAELHSAAFGIKITPDNPKGIAQPIVTPRSSWLRLVTRRTNAFKNTERNRLS